MTTNTQQPQATCANCIHFRRTHENGHGKCGNTASKFFTKYAGVLAWLTCDKHTRKQEAGK